MSKVDQKQSGNHSDPGGFFRRRARILKYILITGGVIRDPVIIYTLLASLGRTGLMYAINRTAISLDEGYGWSVILLALCAGVMLFFSYHARVRGFVSMHRIMQAIRVRLARKLLRANIDFLLSRDHGKVYAAVTQQTQTVSEGAMHVIGAFEALVIVSFAVPYLFVISPIAGFMTIAAVGMGLLGYFFLDVPARRKSQAALTAYDAFCNRVDDLLAGWKEVRLRDQRRKDLEDEVSGAISDVSRLTIESERLFSGSTVVGQSAMILLICFVLVAVPALGGGGAEVLFQILTVVLLSSGPFELLFNALPRLGRAEIALEHIQALEAALEDNRSRGMETAGDPSVGFTSIDFRQITANVREPGRPKEEGFDLGPLDLSLTAGETVFICGGNGSGKTTLMSLLAGLRHPDSGEILLNGAPVTDDNIATYRALFSGVFSNFHIFDRAFGLDADEIGVLISRIDDLNLADRVSMIEDRFSSTSLSAGQRRRLALAVALAEDRPIIILDEFAADQDPANRAFFYDTLVPELAASGKLVIAVTHDDHQFAKCDRLIKMAAGRIESEHHIRAASKDSVE